VAKLVVCGLAGALVLGAATVAVGALTVRAVIGLIG
jgi:hypothetical protein